MPTSVEYECPHAAIMAEVNVGNVRLGSVLQFYTGIVPVYDHKAERWFCDCQRVQSEHYNTHRE